MNAKGDIKSETILLIILIIPSSFISIVILANTNDIHTEKLRSDTWILDLQENGFKNSQWYFINLNDGDRRKIRQAFDYMIDRDHIINEIEEGLGTKTLSNIAPNTKYYLNNGTEPRMLNKDKAKSLLSEVFGYIYDSQIDDPNTPYDETFPYFNFTMLLPDNNLKRVQWGTDIVNEWKSIGIDVTLIETGLSNVEEVLNSDEYDINGMDFNHGGLDGAFVGLPLYGFDSKSPALQISHYRNFLNYFEKTTEIMNLIKIILYDQNIKTRDKAIQDYQQWTYNNVPASYIFWINVLNIRNKGILGINDFTKTNYENWTYSGHQNVTVLAKIKEQFEWLNPIFTPVNWFASSDGQIAINALYRGLFYTTTENNLIPSNAVTYPYFTDWYNKSSDGLTWFVNMKEGLKWHDGVELNTSDVKFTFDLQKFNNITEAFQGDKYLTSIHTTYQSWNIGNINVDIINSTLIKFTLEKPYSFFKEDLLTMPIIPEHILKNIPENNMLSDSSNTGINGTVIGNGPYIFVNKTVDPVTITLQKWSDWNISYNSLISNNKMNQIVPGSSVPTLEYINFITIGDESQALESLKNGTADITFQFLIPFYFLNLADQVTDPLIVINEIRVTPHFINYNQFSSIWGLVPIEPCKLYNDISCILPDPPTITTTHTDTIFLDSLSILSSFLVLSIFIIYSRKKNH